jgi:isoleucyl-tRNA synthetase
MTVADKDYKHTLNLPETKFPMQANLAQREPEMLARWESGKLYERVLQESKGRPVYWFVDGPPYANGDIHIGHVVNKVLKDIVVKAARLSGHYAPFIPGWDCHGLPIEAQVERKHGRVGPQMDAKTFRAKCREYAEAQIDRQRADFKRLGVLADWERPYLTMNRGYEAEQLRALARIVERGHVIRGQKPVYWCFDCHSSLAEAEVEYADKKSPAIDLVYPVGDAADLARRFGAPGVKPAGYAVWTTTPWTVPGIYAIAVNRELDYVLAEVPGFGPLAFAEGLLEACAKRYGQELKVVARAKGEALLGATARHPYADRSFPVIHGDHVTLEVGTGLVHTAPAHGPEDFGVAMRDGVPFVNPVGSDGRYLEGTERVAGIHVRKVDPVVIEVLQQEHRLLHQATIDHSYPHCWRHKTPLIYRATSQWFISMDDQGLRRDALAGIEATRWIPDWGQARIHEMVEGRPDWCISRQRYWGVPLALFVDKVRGTLHPQMPALLRKIADRVQTEGLEAWFGSGAADWLGSEAEKYDKLTDTLDVWFDSGVVHQCSFATQAPEFMHGGEAPIADMYLEGSDQHRGWFMSSLLTSSAMYARPPFKAVLTHGFTVDEQGRKMSKSLGNVVAPQQVLKTLGADILRLWVAASDYSGEIAISENLLKRISDAYRRIRNTVRYLLGNLHGFDPARDLVPPEQMLAIDRWALDAAWTLQDEMAVAYGDSQFHLVYQKVHNYAVDLGALYLDILKDRLYTLPARSLGRRSAQTAMFHIAEALVRWIAPVLSFTAHEIWQTLPGERSASVFSQPWYEVPHVAGGTGFDWDTLRKVRLAVAKVLEDLRVKGDIGQSLAADLTLYADERLLPALQGPGEELRFWFITSSAEVKAAGGRPPSAVAAEIEGFGPLWIDARASRAPKCERCWHRRPEVGENKEHPTLCGRCVDNVAGPGEVRRFI